MCDFTFLPFHGLSDQELLDTIKVERLEYSKFCNIFLNPFDSNDRHDPSIVSDISVDLNAKQIMLKCDYRDTYDFLKLIKSFELRKDICTFFLNVRSMHGKFEEVIHDFDIDSNTYSFFSLCETWLCHDTEALYSIDKYTSFYNYERLEVGELLYTSLRGLHRRNCLACAICVIY